MFFRRRVAYLTAAAVAVAVVLASVAALVITRHRLRDEIDRSLRTLDGQAFQVFEYAPSGRRTTAVALPTPAVTASGGFAQIVRADGTVLPGAAGAPRVPVDERAREVAARKRPAFFTDRDIGGEHMRVLTSPGAPGEAIQIARSLEEVDDSVRGLALALALVTLLGVALAALLGRIVGNAALRRVADVSHDLRTPLTSVRTNVQFLRRAADLDPVERERVLAGVDVQLSELQGLVGDVIDVARDEKVHGDPEWLELDRLVEEAVTRARRLHVGARIDTDLEPCLVDGVPHRIDRAVANLIDNAIKWNLPDQPIEVSLRAGEIRVRDRGPGIAPADAPRLFERFYRARDARHTAGSGIGLAIVQQVAAAHGGTAWAEPAEGGGACFAMRLPVRDAAGAHS
jgi:two-component system, OmpR family, sensor histidine kinase MprB